MKAKTFFSILIILFILIVIPISIYYVGQRQELRKQAAPATTLALSTANREPAIGENITISVGIDTGPNQVTGVELYLTFDQNKVEALDIVPGSFFTNPQTLPKVVDNATGRLNLTILLTRSEGSLFQPPSGIGTVATATFRTKAAGAVTIRLADGTIVGGWGGPNNEDESKDVLTGTTPVNLTVHSGTGGEVTPSVTPSATVAPATPSPTNPSQGLTPTPSPTQGAKAATTPKPTTQPIPVTGAVENTFVFLGIGVLLVFIGFSGLFLLG